MGQTDKHAEQPVTEVAAQDTVAPEAAEGQAPAVDDGDGLAPGQTTADNLGDVLGL